VEQYLRKFGVRQHGRQTQDIYGDASVLTAQVTLMIYEKYLQNIGLYVEATPIGNHYKYAPKHLLYGPSGKDRGPCHLLFGGNVAVDKAQCPWL